MSVYEIVTDRICTMLENGIVPWRRPWASSGLPQNLISRKPYRGLNVFLLSASKYVFPYWVTMRQANELGGVIRKGEQSSLVTFWKRVDKGTEETEEIEDSKKKKKDYFVLRYYHVWNLEQCDLSKSVLDRLPKIETYHHEPIEAVEKIVAGMPNPPAIMRGGLKSSYSPIDDKVTLPDREYFRTAEDEASVIFHELAHSTGHQKRLARRGICDIVEFGSKAYSVEELIAELTSAFLCAEAGISNEVIKNQAAYIAEWLPLLRSDSRMIVHAAAQAQRATDYILNRMSSVNNLD